MLYISIYTLRNRYINIDLHKLHTELLTEIILMMNLLTLMNDVPGVNMHISIHDYLYAYK